MSAATPASVKDARLSHVLACWQRWRAGRRWPARADIDPADLELLLPGVFMVQAVGDGGRLRYILAGSQVRNRLGFELTGRHVDELFSGEQLARLEYAYRVVLAGQGHHAVHRWNQRGTDIMEYRRMLLPLADDHATIDTVFGYALYDRLDGRDAELVQHLSDPVTISVLSENTVPLD